MQIEIHKTYPVYSCPTVEATVLAGIISDAQVYTDRALCAEEVALLSEEVENGND